MSPADSGSGGLIREPTGPHKLLPLWEHPFADMYAAGDGQRKRALLLAFVRTGIGAGEAVREACRDTVKKLAKASSPFIFRILEARRIQDGRLVLAGDLLEGTTVGQHLLDGALGPARTIAIMRQLCHALDTAHGVGVLHGALSVASVILGTVRGRDDAASLTDFGLAGAITAAAMGDHEVEIQPLSPEKVAGEGPSVREDIYLLGAIGYAMLAGEPMFQGAPADVRTSHAERAPAPLDAPEELHAIVRRCVAKSPAERFATARELERALARAQQKLRLTTAWDDLPLRADVSAHGVPAEIARDASQPNPIAARIPSGPYSVIGAPRSPARALAESSGAVQRRDLEAAVRPSAKPAIPPAPKVGVPPPPATPRSTGHKWSPAPKPTAPTPAPAPTPTPAAAPSPAPAPADDRTQRRASALGIDLSRPIRKSEGRLPLPPDAAGVRRTSAAAAEPPKETGRPPRASEASAPALAVATVEPATAEAAPSAKPTAAKTEAKPAEPKPAEAKPPEAKPADAKPAEAKPPEPKPAEAKPPEPKPAEAKPPEPKPDSKTAKPAEPKPDPKPADAKTSKPAATEPDERDDAEAPAVVRPRARAPETRARKPVPAWMLAGGAALVIGVPLLFIAMGDDPPSSPTEVAAREPAKAAPSPAPDPAPPPAADGNDRTPTPTPPPTAAEDAKVPPSDPAGDDDAAELVMDEADDAGDDAAAAAADDAAAAGDDGGATAIADPPPAPAPAPSSSTSPRERAAQLTASAKKAHGAGKVDRAENLYKLALAAYPRSHTAAAALGQIYFNRSQWSKSATYYGKAVAAAPGSSDYRIRLGDAHFKNGKYAEARKHYAKAGSMGNKGAAARIAKVDAKLGK